MMKIMQNMADRAEGIESSLRQEMQPREDDRRDEIGREEEIQKMEFEQQERRWEELLSGRMLVETTVSHGNSSSSPAMKIEKFRKMEQSYLTFFEAHMNNYNVDRAMWAAHLIPLVRSEVMNIYVRLPEEEWNHYDLVKKTILDYLLETQVTFCE